MKKKSMDGDNPRIEDGSGDRNANSMLKMINFPARRAGDARRKQSPKQSHRSGDRDRNICELRNALCIEDGASDQRENRYFF